jgi:gas vesicle protein
MTELINTIKTKVPVFSFRILSRAILSLLAVVLLVTTTACNNAGEMKAKVDPTRTENPQGAAGKLTELYKPIAPAEGGMNNYSDIDPRQNTAEAKAKADRLINKTEDLTKGDTNPFKQLGKQLDDKGLRDRAGDTADQLNRSAKETAEDVAKGTKRGYQNLKENTKSFADDVKSAADDIGDDTKAKANDLKNNIRKAS